MFMTLRIALRAIARNKMRAGLTALGIIIGVAAVIAMVGIGQGASAMVKQQMASMGTAVIWVQPGQAASGGISFGAGSTITLTPEDAAAIARECPDVEAVAPIIRARATQLIYGNSNWVPMELDGTTPEFLRVRDWGLAEGEFFSVQDIHAANKVCVIGQTIVDNLFGGIDPIGEILRIKSVPFKVVGVFEKKGANMMGFDQDDIVAAPLTTVKKRLNGSQFNNVDRILVAAKADGVLKNCEREVTELLHERHHIGPTQADDFNIRNPTEITNAMAQMTSTMMYLLAAVASVSLLVGGVGIMNIMLVSVTERTREIGIRMAIGARGRDILRQFLVESVVLSALGGLLGIALGLIVSRLIAGLAHWPTLFSPESVLISFSFAGMVGVFFGYYPARKASKLDPIECLRYE